MASSRLKVNGLVKAQRTTTTRTLDRRENNASRDRLDAFFALAGTKSVLRHVSVVRLVAPREQLAWLA
jgi:hypothetical protein